MVVLPAKIIVVWLFNNFQFATITWKPIRESSVKLKVRVATPLSFVILVAPFNVRESYMSVKVIVSLGRGSPSLSRVAVKFTGTPLLVTFS